MVDSGTLFLRERTEQEGSFSTWIVTEAINKRRQEDFRETRRKLFLIIFSVFGSQTSLPAWKEVRGTDFSFCSLAKL